MVFVNSKKYACESCIKGHRSSSCHHNDRPLFEIKKKGRPVSQCEKCREARHTRRIHGKCTCDPSKPNAPPPPAPSSSSPPTVPKKTKRFVPMVPSLPNGLRDAFKNTDVVSSEPVDPRQRVDALLNPCHCKSVWDCKCRPSSSAGAGSSNTSGSAVFSDGLAALAHVAACCSPVSPIVLPTLADAHPWPSGNANTKSRSSVRINHPHGHNTSTTKSVRGTAAKSAKRSIPANIPVPTLRPIRLSATPTDVQQPKHPHFATPASSSVAARAVDDHCGCGQRCACPGCTKHQGGDSDSSPAGCGAYSCSSCVDYEGGVELPGQAVMPTFIDQFFARAASLPSPPAARSASLDPMNVTVYPRALFTDGGGAVDARGLGFGLVNIPKLECCGGRCSCPEGSCSCGTECGGCCREEASTNSPQVAPSRPKPVPGSCCS